MSGPPAPGEPWEIISGANVASPTVSTPTTTIATASAPTNRAAAAIRTARPLTAPSLRHGRQAVADAAHRRDVRRLARTVAELGPQPPHVHADAAAPPALAVPAADGARALAP